VVQRFVVPEDGEVDPGEVGPGPGAPDDVGHLKGALAVQQGVPVAHPGDPGDAHLAADRCVHGQHVVADDPEQQGLDDETCGRALDAERDMAGFSAGQPGRVPCGDLGGDLGPRVARSYHQDDAVVELGGVAVAGGVELDDAGIKLVSERRHPGDLVGRHGDHHVVGLEPPVARRDHEPVYPDAGADRQLEACRVGLQVVGHLSLWGNEWAGAGNGSPASAL